ncbi:MAG: hypothetical protein DVB31_02955 [Verrucomicrobia bacterium]|nr:MAG: hypothetical protein DVB31_02955 [Verrucomicrobiota bacterium]
MKIKLLKPMLVDAVLVQPGAVVEVGDKQADFFVSAGFACIADPEVPAPEPAGSTPAASKPRGGRRRIG